MNGSEKASLDLRWLAFVIGALTVLFWRRFAKGERDKPSNNAPASRTVAHSSFAASWVITPDLCDSSGRLYGGEMLKLIDVMAGVASRKHCECRVVTVSVDRVIFLSEVRTGDLIHLSVSVNRSWKTSLETGVRCMREDGKTGKKTYACHAYLTFVALPPKPAPKAFYQLFEPKPFRVTVPVVEPNSMLEKKRFLLAGRRRGHRVQRHPETWALMTKFRDFVFSIRTNKNEAIDEAAQERQILKLQRDLVVEAYLTHNPDVHLSEDGKMIVAELEGFMEPIQIPLEEVDKAAKATGHGAFRPLQTARAASDLASPGLGGDMQDGMYERLDIEDTLGVGMWIVRPQHTNSANNLFGGQLLLWIEQVSSMAARKVASVRWSTATVDGMTFKESIMQGETVFIRAVALHAWESSVEVYAVATAEGIDSPARFVADAFLTLIAMDPSTGRPLRGRLRHLLIPEGAAHDLAAGADKRRDERLEDKRVLQAMKRYASFLACEATSTSRGTAAHLASENPMRRALSVATTKGDESCCPMISSFQREQ